ncbi:MULTISPECIES: NAD(P)/FAD-dependent oxidoreductase [Bacillaceae]|uniref:FAD-binding oxidoreductase n=1 Tax=Evansella alkalicola TaxID=745819 RepID=A0ABS6JPZ0_9BACI|nr:MULTISPECIES: FAD-dependent oxidoreductase [Bacillaceae]MBU9720623.1 FAD-binding oxidoreductase [Bacillus alkalicola]
MAKSHTIIGAGILGASTAYHLTKRGEKVTLIDRLDYGQATDAAAGIVCPWLTQRRNKAWYKLAKEGAKYYPTLIQELEEQGETNTGYSRVGAISLHTDEKKLEKMMERALKRREEAPEIGEITLLPPNETNKIFPVLSRDYSSVHVSGGARVNGRGVRNALVRAAVKNGATFIKGDAKLVFEETSVIGASVNGQVYESDQVIVTAGAWASKLLKPLNLNFEIKPQKAQIIHLLLNGVDTSNWPVVMPPNNQYILSFGEGRVVIGATHEDDQGFDNRITAGGVHEILDKALSVAPGLSNASIEEVRVGFRPVAPNFLPVFGTIPQYKGLIVANGLGASGLTTGPFLGSELAKLACYESTELNIDDYSIS